MNKQEIQEAFIARLIDTPPATLYNIGVGPKTEYLTLKGIYPEMEVFGCEPLAEKYEGLCERFNGKLLKVGISDKPGTSSIFYNESAMMGANMLNKRKGDKRTTITTITLDEMDATFGNPDRILLWADIEGMEHRMLKSGPDLLASGRVKWINLEEHLDNPSAIKKVDQLLATFDYERVVAYNKHPNHQDVVYVHASERRA
jgi:FkbM family methyltransferase